jgi:hypothetical protein
VPVYNKAGEGVTLSNIKHKFVVGGVVGKCERLGGSMWETWWLIGSTTDCCPAILGLNPASPLPTADCQSPGRLSPGMALGCELTSVRGNRGENYENQPLVCQKHLKEKKHKFVTVFL